MNRRRLITGVLLTALVAMAGAEEPLSLTLTKDIVYGNSGGVDLKLDLARPDTSDSPLPLLIFIHGGGWQTGDKSDFEPMVRQFASSGYVAVSVNYRVTPEHPWPAQIEDVKCAVRYLRTNAAKYAIDPERFAAAGHSAGAHLALLLGLMDPKDGFEGDGGNPAVSSRVQAVVNVSGPTDLRVWRALPEAQAEAKAVTGKDFEDLLADFAGTVDRSAPVIAEASPITYVDADAPPVLTLHGSADPVVPVGQAELLHAALDGAGLKNHKLVVLEGADHNFGDASYVLRIVYESQQFADRWLKGIEPGTAAVDTGAEAVTEGAGAAE